MAKSERTDNQAEVIDWLDRLIDAFDFTLAGDDQSLGRDMANAVALGIHERTVSDKQTPKGQPL